MSAWAIGFNQLFGLVSSVSTNFGFLDPTDRFVSEEGTDEFGVWFLNLVFGLNRANQSTQRRERGRNRTAQRGLSSCAVSPVHHHRTDAAPTSRPNPVPAARGHAPTDHCQRASYRPPCSHASRRPPPARCRLPTLTARGRAACSHSRVVTLHSRVLPLFTARWIG